MKNILKQRTTHIFLLAIALGAASGILATTITTSSLSEYEQQLSELTHPIGLDDFGPKAFPNSYADAVNRFADGSRESVVSVFSKSAKTPLGYLASSSLATGVVVTSDGWVVVSSLPGATVDNTVIQIKDKVYDVSRIVTDPLTQVVFLKCSATNVPVIGFGKGFELSMGDQLFVTPRADQLVPASVVGQQWQEGTLLSSDIPSRRVLIASSFTNVNGPVFNLSGAFVGFILKKETQSVLLPFETMTPVLNALLEKKPISHTILGLTYLDISHAIGLDETTRRNHATGALLMGKPAVKKGSVAAAAGLKDGDIITKYNGEDIDQKHGLSEFVLRSRVGDKVLLTIDRNGETKNIEVVLGESVK